MTHSIKSSRIKLILVFSLFLGPLLFAFLWYYGLGASFSPNGKTNHSPLISPVFTLSSFSDILDNGKTFNLESIKRRWTVVHIANPSCSELCRKALYQTRQTRIAVGKDANRIQRVLILADSGAEKEIVADHADLLLISYFNSELLPQLQSVITRENIGPGDAIMIDPLGNAMMVIPVDLSPSLLLKDLKKLLKLSRVG